MSLTRRDLVVALATACVLLTLGAVARTAPSVLMSSVFDWNAMKAEPTEAGESRTVRFALDARDLSHVDAEGRRLVGAGRYRLTVGGGQPGTGAPLAATELEIRGAKALPR